MTRASLVVLAPMIALAAACNGKPQAAATPAVDSTPPAPVAVPVVDSAKKLAADSAARMAAPGAKQAPRMETGDVDRTIRPKFTINEKTGKIDTIRRP